MKARLAIQILLSLVLAGCSPTTTRENKHSSEIPPVILMDSSGQQFSAQTLKGYIILIFFSPGCDHCQREAGQIHDERVAFEKYNLYFISMDSFSEMDRFAKDYGLTSMANVHFLRADGASVTKSLGNIDTPTILVFSDTGKLLGRFNGETNVKEIIKVL